MKKVFLISLLILLLTSSAETEGLASQKLEFTAGLRYSNYLYEKYDREQVNDSWEQKQDEDYFVREDLHQGTGYYSELVYWWREELGLGVGGQQSKMTAEWQSDIEAGEVLNHKYRCSLDSYYTKLIYAVNSKFKPYVNFNYSLYSEHYAKKSFATDIKQGTGFGLLLGVDYIHSAADNLDLTLAAGYQLTAIKINKKYSSYQRELIPTNREIIHLKGLQIKGGISYKF